MRYVVLMLSLSVTLGTATAQDTKAYLRGPVIVMVAIAHVLELRCGQKGEVVASLAKAKRAGVMIDPNDKHDADAIQTQVGYTVDKAEALGVASWCRLETERLNALFAKP